METQRLMILSTLLGALALVGCNNEIDSAPRARLEPSPSNPAVQMAQSVAGESLQAFSLDADASSVEFVGAKVTGSHRGSFDKPLGEAKVSQDGTLRGLSIDIDTKNLAIEPAKLQAHLRSADFFDVETYPKASFSMVTLRPESTADGRTHEVTGDLTIRGRTHRVSFPATIKVGRKTVEASAAFKVDRREFDINYTGMADDLIEHDVLLDLSLRFNRQ